MSDETRGLEEKIAYLEKHLSDLDKVVRELSGQMDVMLTQMKRLIRSEPSRNDNEEASPANDPPPHY